MNKMLFGFLFAALLSSCFANNPALIQPIVETVEITSTPFPTATKKPIIVRTAIPTAIKAKNYFISDKIFITRVINEIATDTIGDIDLIYGQEFGHNIKELDEKEIYLHITNLDANQSHTYFAVIASFGSDPRSPTIITSIEFGTDNYLNHGFINNFTQNFEGSAVLPAGDYELYVYLDDVLVYRSTFEIKSKVK